MELLTIFIAALLTHNIALTYLLGMCPFMALSGNVKTAMGMGMAIIFVVTLTAAVNWPIYWLLLVPLKAEVLAYIVFIIVIAGCVQLVEMVVERFFPILEASFGIFLPLITVNCVVLAVSLFMVLREYSYAKTLVFAFGTACGWTLAIMTVAAIKDRMLLISDIPKGLHGAGITMIVAGILSLAFLGFGGMVSIQ